MAKLSRKKKKSFNKNQYGLPSQRKYPMPDKSHARSAKAYSTQQYKKGKLSKSSKDRIHAKANRVLGKKKSGGRKKKR